MCVQEADGWKAGGVISLLPNLNIAAVCGSVGLQIYAQTGTFAEQPTPTRNWKERDSSRS